MRKWLEVIVLLACSVSLGWASWSASLECVSLHASGSAMCVWWGAASAVCGVGCFWLAVWAGFSYIDRIAGGGRGGKQ